jgi:hypothetical protein
MRRLPVRFRRRAFPNRNIAFRHRLAQTQPSAGQPTKRQGLEEFSTNLKIQAGDLIGIDATNASDTIDVAEVSGGQLRDDLPASDGSVVPSAEAVNGKEIELSALKVTAPKPQKVGNVLKQTPKPGKVLAPARGSGSSWAAS